MCISIETFKSVKIELVNKNGEICLYSPQRRYKKKNGSLLNGLTQDTSFCRFLRMELPKTSGVYLWVDDEDEIIYIGETKNLYNRFNDGYGRISPRNCYKDGQYTNIKMNMAALAEYENNRAITIYYFETGSHKDIEKHLLCCINTKFNTKNNKGCTL